MASEDTDMHENNASPTNGVNEQQAPGEGTDDRSKTRHPRWSRQETFVLIEGKQVAENRGRKGRRSNSVFGSDQLESKWDSVSSFCRKHGVNRGPVQCRKRWSNLVGDFRKIKAWESQVKEQAESFWIMRNDSRREKKLPGFFDREVYDVLDGRAFANAAYPLKLARETADAKDGEAVLADEEEEEEDEEEAAEAVFDSGRHAATENGLFSDSQQLMQEGVDRSLAKQAAGVTDTPTKTFPSPMPISEKYQLFHPAYSNQGMRKAKHPGLNFWRGSMPQEGWKRRRLLIDGRQDTNLEEKLIKILEKNSSMLNAQLQAQNKNYQLDRQQQKDQNESFVTALTKITDALGRIADKL